MDNSKARNIITRFELKNSKTETDLNLTSHTENIQPELNSKFVCLVNKTFNSSVQVGYIFSSGHFQVEFSKNQLDQVELNPLQFRSYSDQVILQVKIYAICKLEFL